MEQEIWKDIEWYEWLYQISNIGRVKSLNYKRTWKHIILSNNIMRNWYHKIWLRNKGIYKKMYIHRLVAQAFLWLDISNTKILVCHKDDNPSNNMVENIFLWNHKENSRDMLNKWRSVIQKDKRLKVSKWYNLEWFDRYENYSDWFIYI